MSELSFAKVIGPRVNNILAVSEYMISEILNRHSSADDNDPIEDYSFGWKKAIRYTIKNKPYIQGFIFTGLDGCGKHTAAELVCHYVFPKPDSSESEQWGVVFLSGSDFCFNEMETRADEYDRKRNIEKQDFEAFTDDTIHSFFEELIFGLQGKEKLLLVIDNSEENECIDQVYKRLEKYICISSQDDGYPLIFTVLIEKDINHIPSSMKKRFSIMRMSLPNKEQRQQLLKNLNTDPDILELVAQSTEGWTYSQLRDLAMNLYAVGWDKDLTYSSCQSLIASQRDFDELEDYNALDSAKLSFYNSLEVFVTMLPQLLERMPTAYPLPSKIVAEEKTIKNTTETESEARDYQTLLRNLKVKEEKAKDDIQKQCENMRFGSLVEKSLGVNIDKLQI